MDNSIKQQPLLSTDSFQSGYAFTNSLYTQTQTISNRFASALKIANSQKFVELNALIEEAISCNSKEIGNCYQTLLEDIFAFDSGLHVSSNTAAGSLSMVGLNPMFKVTSSSGLNLRNVTNASQQDQQALLLFLLPDGPLFQLIRYLMDNHLFRCEFPGNCLPAPSKLLIEEGVTPRFYTNRLSSDPMSLCPTKVILNPFEFYFYHFAYFITIGQQGTSQFDPSQLQQPAAATGTPTVYLRLLESYLDTFLPLSSQRERHPHDSSLASAISPHQQSIWKSLSTTTSSLLHLGSSSFTDPGSPAPQSSLPKSSLLNLKPLQQQLRTNNNTDGYGQSQSGFHHHSNYNHARSLDPLGSLVYKSETIINIFTELWLNVNISNSLLQKKKQSANSSGSGTPVGRSVNYHHLQPQFCPSVENMRCVRTLIKHLHFFANSVSDRSLDLALQLTTFDNDLDDVKKSIWTNKFEIQKKLFGFIRLAFDRWPCDASFTVPLETWLSFLRPWRYTPAKTQENKENLEADKSINSQQNSFGQGSGTTIESRWKPFIVDNLLFYTIIFRELMPRFSKIDLASPKNAYMLYRVCKIFTDGNLIGLLKEAEAEFDNPSSTSWLASASVRGSLLSPNIRNASQTLRNNESFLHLIEDTDDFEYSSFFSTQVREKILQLLVEIQKIQHELSQKRAELNQKAAGGADGFLAYCKSLFSTSDGVDAYNLEQNLNDLQKAVNNLNHVHSIFSSLFEIDPSEVEAAAQTSNSQLLNQTQEMLSLSSSKLNYESGPLSLDEKRLDLLKKNKIRYLGNPDQQPVRTFEFYYLVLLLGYLSNFINNYYGEHFQQLYERQDLLGYLARLLLHAPQDYFVIEKHGPKASRQLKKRLPARVNLRTFASKKLYFFIGLAYLLLILNHISSILALVFFIGVVSCFIVLSLNN